MDIETTNNLDLHVRMVEREAKIRRLEEENKLLKEELKLYEESFPIVFDTGNTIN